MASFEYAALDAQGRMRTGTIAAAGPREARAQLESRRLVPVRLDAARAREGGVLAGGRFGTRDLALLTRQLATLPRRRRSRKRCAPSAARASAAACAGW